MAQVIDGKKSIGKKELEFLADELKNGKIFILPTSTLYGICANALDVNAVERVYNIKKRDKSKPMIVLINNLDMLKKLVINLNDMHEKIISKFWPGPLTIVFRKSNLLPSIVTAKKNSIAVRMDSSDIVNELVNISRVPVIAPSANVSGNLNIDSIENLDKEVFEKVDYIIDIGKLEEIQESTLIVVEDGKIKILREGKIKKESFSNFS